MARSPLQDVVFPHWFQSLAERDGFYVYETGTTTAASVYAASTGTTTVTQPVPFFYNRSITGWVEPSEYTFSAGGRTFTTEVTGGDGSASLALGADPMQDPAGACENFPFRQINSIAATATSQTLRLVRIVPRAKIVAAKIVSRSGSTAAATHAISGLTAAYNLIPHVAVIPA